MIMLVLPKKERLLLMAEDCERNAFAIARAYNFNCTELGDFYLLQAQKLRDQARQSY